MLYYVRKTILQPSYPEKDIAEELLRDFKPRMHDSTEYKNWIAIIDLRTCLECMSRHGSVYLIDEEVFPEPPLHTNCRCVIEELKAIYAGEATISGKNGADWWLKYFGKLPDYYISLNDAKNAGYKAYLGNLSTVAPGKMLVKGEYANKNGHLPSASGRTWYEADINYSNGYRGEHRVVFSNDGLVFVTYDHYQTFQVIE